jgi:predicted metal-dependent hydrolase
MEEQIMAAGETINITYVKSVRAKRLSVTIGPFKPVRVAFPVRSTLRKAQEFLESKFEWVKKTVNKMKEIELQTAI